MSAEVERHTVEKRFIVVDMTAAKSVVSLCPGFAYIIWGYLFIFLSVGYGVFVETIKTGLVRHIDSGRFTAFYRY